MVERLKFALDQNFPPMVLEVADLFPNAVLAPLFKIDPRLCNLDDRKLIIYLRQAGWHGLVTNNYRMLWVPSEISAIVKARICVFAVQGLGDDPLRATGAVMLHLPAVLKRVALGRPQVFRMNPRAPVPDDAWEYVRQSAHRRSMTAEELYDQVKVTDDELSTPVLE